MEQTIKQQADGLVEKHFNAYVFIERVEATAHAIIDIESTIEALEEAKKRQQLAPYWIDGVIAEKQEILNELKGRI